MLVAIVLCGLGTAWGAEVTFGPSAFSGQGTSGTGSEISATIDGVTFACDKGYGTTQIRCYASSTITISSSNTITSISFTFDGSYTGGLNKTGYTGLSTTSWVQKLGSQARITEVKVTYTPATPAYTITAQSNNESFGTVSLTGNVITGAPNSGYRYASPAYTVSPANSATVDKVDNTFTVTPSANTTVTINFEAIPTYTVTLGDDNSTLTEAIGNAGVTLPTRNALNGYEFAGWSETNVSEETTSSPTIIPAGAYSPTTNITLYPVYSKSGGGTTPSAFSVGDTGNYAIVSAEQNGKYYALPTNPTVNNGKITALEITVSEINGVKYVTTANASGFTWTIASATNGYTLSDGSKFIYHSNGGSSGTNINYGTSTSYTWAFTADGDYVTMAGMSGSTTNSRGLLFSGTTIGGYALSNAGNSGYYKVMILPISAGVTTYYWSAPIAAAVEIPSIVVAENPFLFSTTATINCATEDAAIKYSFDGENWSDYSSPLTITETKTIYAKAIKGENESDVAQVTATKNLATPSVTISGDLTLDLDGKTNVNAGTLTAAVIYNNAAVEGASVTWSSNKPEVATIDASTGAVTLLTTGTVTFTATYAGNSDYAEAVGTKVVTVIDNNAPGTANNPYTVADVLTLYENDIVPSNQVYVKGIISEISSLNTLQYTSARYYISDSGTKEHQFYVYNGKYIDGADFTVDDQIQVGDEVVIYGKLTSYQGINEFAGGNYIVSLNRPDPVELAAPIIFHDGGTYEQALKVAMAGQGTIKYKLNGGAEQTYSAPIDVNETTTITAWVEQDGAKSDEISKTFTIETKEAGPSIEDGYYTIKNNGNGKYVNVAGRRTVTFVDEAATDAAPGTVIKVKATDGQLEVLRSQGVDIPGYAQRAMNYVPPLVKAIVERLGENNFIGEPGLNNVANEFTDKFDYHLYLEKLGNEGNNYRIYGKTPSMTPVVDFYAKNKEVIDGRLPYLEGFVKDIFTRIADKLGRGQGWVDSFKIHDLWVKMGGTESGLTEPVDEDAAAISQFYTQILSSEKNVWNFAHETMMIYWGRVKEYINENEDIASLIGDYAKYIDKVEYIQPNSKYYIVQQNGQMDFISQYNTAITTSDVAAETDFTAWKLEKRSDFNVTFNAENTLNGDKELYTTLYTDFAYTLPDDVKAYAVTSINKKTGVAVKKEITGVIPAQTPVLLKLAIDEKVTENQTQRLTLSTEDGTVPETNLLVGPDYLINEYKINAPQVESMLSVLSMLSQSLADQYEYLKRKNAGTVNNKYFFGLTEDDLLLCTFKNEDDEEDCVVRNLSTGDQKLGFYNNWEVNANKAFLVSEEFDPIKLTLLGDVNRDGDVNVTDVSATVDISLGKATPETHSEVYDFDAADANESGSIDVTDAVIIVNISLGK